MVIRNKIISRVVATIEVVVIILIFRTIYIWWNQTPPSELQYIVFMGAILLIQVESLLHAEEQENDSK